MNADPADLAGRRMDGYDRELFTRERKIVRAGNTIMMPVVPFDGEDPILVTARSPIVLRNAVTAYGRAIARENHYDRVLTLNDHDEAWLLRASIATVAFPVGAVATFAPTNNRRPWDWELRWVYAHPFWRGGHRGRLLDRYWPAMCARYGAFGVRRPISPAGAGLLRRLGWTVTSEYGYPKPPVDHGKGKDRLGPARATQPRGAPNRRG